MGHIPGRTRGRGGGERKVRSKSRPGCGRGSVVVLGPTEL